MHDLRDIEGQMRLIRERLIGASDALAEDPDSPILRAVVIKLVAEYEKLRLIQALQRGLRHKKMGNGSPEIKEEVPDVLIVCGTLPRKQVKDKAISIGQAFGAKGFSASLYYLDYQKEIDGELKDRLATEGSLLVLILEEYQKTDPAYLNWVEKICSLRDKDEVFVVDPEGDRSFEELIP